MAEVKDVSPGLLKAIKESFDKEFSGSKRIAELYEKIKDGSATYVEANKFAIEVGEMLARSFQNVLSEDILPDQRMYYNIAKSVVEPMMINNYDLVAIFAENVQNNLNKNAKLGIKAIKPDLNRDRIDGIINRLSTTERYNDISWILKEPVVIFSQSIIDDSIKANAEFQYEAGLSPRIERTSTGKCCDWCNEIVGIYEYPDVPKDVYRRHDFCRCKVNFMVGKYRKNVHNNNFGKRRYVQDKYGNYIQTKEARLEHARQMEATEKIRKEQARQKRIETWEKKKR